MKTFKITSMYTEKGNDMPNCTDFLLCQSLLKSTVLPNHKIPVKLPQKFLDSHDIDHKIPIISLWLILVQKAFLEGLLYSWFSLTSYQNSEAWNNRFGFQNVYGIVKNSKLHIWAKFWSERTFRLRVIGTRVSDIFSKKCMEWPSWCPT